MKPPSLLFGTSGLRCSETVPPLSDPYPEYLGQALGKLFSEILKLSGPVTIGWDTRSSSERIAHSLSRGLRLHYATKLLGVTPTPLVAAMLEKERSEIGIVITASHNKSPDNGIKLIFLNRDQLRADETAHLQKLFETLCTKRESCEKTFPEVKLSQEEILSLYLNKITPHLKNQFQDFPPIIVDAAHGAASPWITPIFDALQLKHALINNKPDGSNINLAAGSESPELLQKLCKEQNQIGCALDGDADRIIASDQNGLLKDGDDMLALFAKARNYQIKSVAGTIMSTRGLESFLASHQIKLFRSQVGEHHLRSTMEQTESPFGAEPSGHILVKGYLNTSDGIFAALLLAESTLEENRYNLTTFDRIKPALINLPVSSKLPLTSKECQKIIQGVVRSYPEIYHIVRYSGTENILRIFVEADNETNAHAAAAQLAHKLQQHLT